MIGDKIFRLAISELLHPIVEHFDTILIKRFEIERVVGVMTSKILICHQTNHHDIRQQTIE